MWRCSTILEEEVRTSRVRISVGAFLKNVEVFNNSGGRGSDEQSENLGRGVLKKCGGVQQFWRKRFGRAD
jgi:hypothetical protein